jgi:disulfide bond formation protein DsbB
MLNRIPTAFIPWIVLAASAATLTTVYFFQYVLGYAPCHLCLQERIPYVIAIGAALIAGILAREANLGVLPVIFIGICAVAFAIGAGISTYHVGVEYKWWAGPSGCSGVGGLISNSLQDLQFELQTGLRVPQCDKVAWSLFGISLAGWNFLISTAAALTALWLLSRAGRRA